MDDVQALREAWAGEAPLSDARRRAARTTLLERARSKRRRVGVRVGALGATALAVAVTAAAVDLAGVGSERQPAGLGVPVARASQVLEQAAVAAGAKPFAAPRDDQWIYHEERFTRDGGAPTVQRTWGRADGAGRAWFDESGVLRVVTTEPPRESARTRGVFLDGYRAAAALPTDPAELLRWGYAQAMHITNGPGSTDDGDVYGLLNHILRADLPRPELEAAIFRAMKQIPGVTVETVDVSGRPALALGLQTSSWLREELLLDPQTSTYLGERSTVTRDAVVDPAKVGNATGEVKQGSRLVVERLTTAVVDRPGQRP